MLFSWKCIIFSSYFFVFAGRHRAALRDFEKAMSYEPSNKKLHTEVRKTREAIKACVKRTPRQCVPIRELAAPIGPPGFVAAFGASKEEVKEIKKEEIKKEKEESKKREERPIITMVEEEEEEEEEADAEAEAEADAEAVEEEEGPSDAPEPPNSPDSDTSWVMIDEEAENDKADVGDVGDVGVGGVDGVGGAGDDSDDEIEASGKTPSAVPVVEIPNEIIVEKERARMAARTALNIARAEKKKKITEIVPKTSYEFTRVWRSISEEQKLTYLADTVGPKVLPKLFKQTGMESDLLLDLLRISSLSMETKHLLLVCDGFTKMSRFGTTLMFLQDEERQVMSEYLLRVVSDMDVQQKFPKRYGRVKSGFGL